MVNSIRMLYNRLDGLQAECGRLKAKLARSQADVNQAKADLKTETDQCRRLTDTLKDYVSAIAAASEVIGEPYPPDRARQMMSLPRDEFLQAAGEDLLSFKRAVTEFGDALSD